MTREECTREGWSRAVENGESCFTKSPHKKVIIAFINGAQIEWINEDNSEWTTSQPPQNLHFASHIMHRVENGRIT